MMKEDEAAPYKEDGEQGITEEMKAEKQERINKCSKEIIKPIMDRVYGIAFDCIEQFHGDSNDVIVLPLGVKEGVLETLDEIIEHCRDQASFYDSASLIGFAMGKDGLRPGRQYRSMGEIATGLRDLIKAKDDQVKDELAWHSEQEQYKRTAEILGF